MNLKWVEIDSSALLNNISVFQDRVGRETKIFAVLKANAYGHGLTTVAHSIKDKVYGFAVNHIDEALTLRNAGIENPILTIGYTLQSRLFEAVKNNITLCVYSEEIIEELGKILQQAQDDTYCKVHIKVDTGLSRQGVFPEDVLDFIQHIRKYSNIEIEGIYTHFANIEDTTDDTYANFQLERFEKVLAELEENNIHIPIKHTACTAAAILYDKTYFNAIRLGIGLYGMWPSIETRVTANVNRKNDLHLQPVMTWKTRVAQVKWIDEGTPVAYGLSYLAKHRTKIAILPVGYSDGYDRKLSNNSYVVIRDKKVPILGRVMMNTIVVDITEIDDVKAEDEVILLGRDGMTAEEMGLRIGSINYEIVTRVNWDLERIVFK